MQTAAQQHISPATVGYYLVHDTSPIGLNDKPDNKGPAYELRDADFNKIYSANLKSQPNRLEQRIQIRSCQGSDDFVLAPKRKILNLSYCLSQVNQFGDTIVAELTRKKNSIQLLNPDKQVIANTICTLPDRKLSDYVVDVLDQDFSKDPQHEYQMESGGVVVGQGLRKYVPKPESEIVVHSTRWKLLNKVLNKATSKNYSTVYIELSEEFVLEPALLMAFAIAHHYFYVVNIHDSTA